MVIRKQKPISAAFAAFQRRNIISQTDAWRRAREAKMGILGIDGTIIHSLCRIKYCRTSNRSCPGLPEVG